MINHILTNEFSLAAAQLPSAILVSNAIESFNKNYHDDYDNVRGLAKHYMDSPSPSNLECELLAGSLHRALLNWGACKRKAPCLKSLQDIANALCADDMHKMLASISKLGLNDHVYWRNNWSKGEAGVFTAELTAILLQISNGIFVHCASVTYPMKALLLLTGFMPALDSKVRKGLAIAGLAGYDKTQFSLPSHAHALEARKIARLVYMLSEWWFIHKDALIPIVTALRPSIANEPGRIVDVLLFQQNQQVCKTIELSAISKKYNMDKLKS